MRAGIAACNGRPVLAVTSPAGKHFMPGNAELERIGIRIVVYPQDILAASVQAIRAALGGLKGGAKPAMASPPSWQRRSVRTSTWPRTRAGPIRADLGAASRSRLAESRR